ncbi:MAG: proton-conducting transporter membrane subunit [Thermoplasmata archaeon]|nr:proton-conducting transporter membrane subunit [Thermoplasmata archaeon]
MINITLDMLFILATFLLLLAALYTLLFLTKKSKIVRGVSLSVALLANAILILISSSIVYSGTALEFNFNQIFPMMGMDFLIDRLAAFFILAVSIIAAAVTVYSFHYLDHYPQTRRKNIHIFLMNLFVLSMVYVVASRNMISFLIFWELMSVSSFFLVCFEFEKAETRKAGLFYFIMTQLSTVFLICAFVILYNETGSFELARASEMSSGLLSMAFISLFIGFGIKAGIIPFHKWLPYAHPAAPSNISALMSGLMIKVALYGLIRFLLYIFPATYLWWGILILIAGTVSAFLGVIYALKEHDLKRLLAYHSIENVGIILMGIGMCVIFTSYGLTALAMISLVAALFHTLNHGLFKSLLFLTAGSVISETRTRNIEEMGGLVKRMPKTAVLFFIGAVSISALPPFNGFVSEFLLFHSLFQSSLIPDPIVQLIMLVCLTVLALTSALAAACFVKAFGTVFLAAPRSEHAAQAKEASWSMVAGPSLLAALCIGLGVFSFQIFSWIGPRIGYSFPLPDMLPAVSVGAVLLLMIVIGFRLTDSRKPRVSETWGCGINSQNSKMEYTASGFSQPIINIFSFIYQPQKINKRYFMDIQETVFREGKVEIRMVRFFEDYVYLPIARTVQRISRWLYSQQNEVTLDPFIFYEFLAILGLILLVGVIV